MEAPPAVPGLPTSLDRLDNGLRVVTIELPHLHSVLLCAYVRVGSRFESAEDSGLSHFLEHMLFRGTRRLPDAFQLNRAVEELGGTLYAETRRDASLYQIGLHREMVAPGLLLLGEILREPEFSQIEIERRIILEEMQEDLDSKGHDINLPDLVCATAFPDHPLGQKITGTLANVRRFGHADLHRHLARHYGARNLVLCVAGGARREEILPLARQAFGALPEGAQHEFAPPGPPPGGPRRVHRDGDPGSQTSLTLAFQVCGETDPDYPALAMIARVMDDGMSTRLYQRIVNELGLAYYTSAGLDTLVDAGLFEMEATATHASVPQLLAEMLALIDGLCEREVAEDELAKAQRRYRWDLLSIQDEPATLADMFGRTELYYPPPPLAARLMRVQAVTPADVQRVARRLLRPDRLTVGTLGRMGARIRGEVREILDHWAARAA